MTDPYYSLVQDVATVDSGPAFKSSQFGEVGEGLPLLRGENIEPGALRWSKTRTWPESLLSGYEHLLVETGDLILGMDRPVISTGLKLATVRTPDVPALLVQRVARIRPKSIDGRYLYLWLSSNEFVQHLQRSATGTQLPHVNLASVRGFRVPRFGEDAERIIIELLDDHLSRLDAADVQLGVALRRIDSLRVASMRRALNAQPDWKVAPINDWLYTSIGGLWGNAPGADEVDVRVIRVTEMKAWGRIAPGTAAVRSITGRQLAGRSLVDGDLLLEKSGGGPKTPVGRVGLVESLVEPSICANFMQLLRPDRSRVSPRFLHYALSAFHLSGGTAPMQTASTNIRNIKASEYLQVKIAVPSLQQQELVVEQIAAEQDATDRLAGAVVAARTYNAGLRRSLLAAAFSGRLTRGASELSAAEEVSCS